MGALGSRSEVAPGRSFSSDDISFCWPLRALEGCGMTMTAGQSVAGLRWRPAWIHEALTFTEVLRRRRVMGEYVP